MKNTLEPLAVINSVMTLVEAIAAAIFAMVLHLKESEMALLMTIVLALGNVARTLWGRSQVTPVTDPRNNSGERLIPTKSGT